MRRMLFFVIIAALGAAGPARAHGLLLECKLEGGLVRVAAFYDDGAPAVKAKVQVFDAGDEMILQGETDDEGKWSFSRPVPGKYAVHLNDGRGHRKRSTIEVPDDTTLPAPLNAEGDKAAQLRAQWLNAGVGVGILLALAFGWMMFTKLRRRGPRDHSAT